MSAVSPPPETSLLFQTDHGHLARAPGGALQLAFSDVTWTLAASDVRAMRASTNALAGDVYRCGADCRWQLHVPGHTVVILTSNEVLRLDTLLEGAVAMLDLGHLLADAGVEWAKG